MSDTKHTPGPWHIYKGHGLYVDSSTAGSICKLAEKRISEQDEANARLIAASPELLEALESILDSATDGRPLPEWLCERLVPASAAIRKAKGQ